MLATQIVAAARAAHEANRAYCIYLGDKSQVSWEDAADWQRYSAIDGVTGVLNGNSPEQSHESWMALKREQGWTYGTIKDPVAKTHPCMLPYHELSEAQRKKDQIFVEVVMAFVHIFGDKSLVESYALAESEQ